MKPNITITDYNALKSMLNNLPYHLRGKECSLLHEEIKRAKKVKDSQMDGSVIRINTAFVVKEQGSGKEMQFTLTYPQFANLQERKLSVLSPLGIALLGFREGMTIEWKLPSGLKKLEILKVVNEKQSIAAATPERMLR